MVGRGDERLDPVQHGPIGEEVLHVAGHCVAALEAEEDGRNEHRIILTGRTAEELHEEDLDQHQCPRASAPVHALNDRRALRLAGSKMSCLPNRDKPVKKMSAEEKPASV